MFCSCSEIMSVRLRPIQTLAACTCTAFKFHVNKQKGNIQYISTCVGNLRILAPLRFLFFIIHCSKDLKEHSTIFPYIAVLNIACFNPHLKAIDRDPECPLILHYSNNAYNKFDTESVLPKSMDNMFALFENNKVKAFF